MQKDLPRIDQKTALLIIDVQKGFINEHTQHIPALVESLQPQYPLVIATRFYNPDNSAFRKLMNWDRFAPSSAETALAFTPLNETIILDKDTYSCLTTEFMALLRQHNISTIHLAGCDTNMCVAQTAAALFETHRYRPVVLAPYCASHSGPVFHEQALIMLEKAIGAQQIWDT